ncbi:hypothetical protein QJS66_07605 [Kocuria rhizophila]|nr:hypothetical protein QJS66_07605 [Kocuria rhizophila]
MARLIERQVDPRERPGRRPTGPRPGRRPRGEHAVHDALNRTGPRMRTHTATAAGTAAPQDRPRHHARPRGEAHRPCSGCSRTASRAVTAGIRQGVSSAIPVLLLFAAAVCEGRRSRAPSPRARWHSCPWCWAGFFFASTAPPRPTWFPLAIMLVPVWMAVASVLNGEVDAERIASISLWAAAAWCSPPGGSPVHGSGRSRSGSRWPSARPGHHRQQRLRGPRHGLVRGPQHRRPLPAHRAAAEPAVPAVQEDHRGGAARGDHRAGHNVSRTTWLAAGIALLWMVLEEGGSTGSWACWVWWPRSLGPWLPDSVATTGPLRGGRARTRCVSASPSGASCWWPSSRSWATGRAVRRCSWTT